MSLAFIFPGQGSQSVGMMSELLESSPLAREVFQRASDAISIDLSALALNGPVERINETEITQPLVLTSSSSSERLARRRSQLPRCREVSDLFPAKRSHDRHHK